MKLSKSMRPFLSVVMIVSVVTFAPSVHCQEKTANDDPSFQFMAMHDLTKYAADATKWEQDVAKMTVFIKDESARGPINEEWLKLYPDPAALIAWLEGYLARVKA